MGQRETRAVILQDDQTPSHQFASGATTDMVLSTSFQTQFLRVVITVDWRELPAFHRSAPYEPHLIERVVELIKELQKWYTNNTAGSSLPVDVPHDGVVVRTNRVWFSTVFWAAARKHFGRPVMWTNRSSKDTVVIACISDGSHMRQACHDESGGGGADQNFWAVPPKLDLRWCVARLSGNHVDVDSVCHHL